MDINNFQKNFLWKKGPSSFYSNFAKNYREVKTSNPSVENLNFSSLNNSKIPSAASQVFSFIEILFFGFYKCYVRKISIYPNQNLMSKEANTQLTYMGIKKYSNSFLNFFTVQILKKLKLTLNFKLLKFITTPLYLGIYIFLILYVFILLSYKYEPFFPTTFSFKVQNFNFLLFTLVTSTSLIESSFIDFILSYTITNYNNIESGKSSLKIQEKYFSKYENTYFTDKKCGEN